jgi:L-asparagine transporter-like permease
LRYVSITVVYEIFCSLFVLSLIYNYLLVSLTYSSFKNIQEEEDNNPACQSTFAAPEQYHEVWEIKKK